MNELEQFWDSVKKEEAALLATSADGKVTMRTISPVYFKDAILFFTSSESTKYKQLQENPHCCVAVGGSFMEAYPEFHGKTMADENTALRNAYEEKFKGAFDKNMEYGGYHADFILLKPARIKGWRFENGIPTGEFDYSF